MAMYKMGTISHKIFAFYTRSLSHFRGFAFYNFLYFSAFYAFDISLRTSQFYRSPNCPQKKNSHFCTKKVVIQVVSSNSNYKCQKWLYAMTRTNCDKTATYGARERTSAVFSYFVPSSYYFTGTK